MIMNENVARRGSRLLAAGAVALTALLTPTYAISFAQDIGVNGDIYFAGTWWGENYFHYGVPGQTVMTSLSKLNGNQFDRAEDPFFTRMDVMGGVDWLMRGRTPSAVRTMI